MILDLDQLERINTAGDRYGHITPGVVAELCAEVRRLTEALSTPVFTGAAAPMYGGIFGAEGVNRDVAEAAFYTGAPTVTVYYGEKHVYTSLAEFCAAHPRDKA